MTNFIRVLTGNVIVNVFKSDAEIWWAAIFRTVSPSRCCLFFAAVVVDDTQFPGRGRSHYVAQQLQQAIYFFSKHVEEVAGLLVVSRSEEQSACGRSPHKHKEVGR